MTARKINLKQLLVFSLILVSSVSLLSRQSLAKDQKKKRPNIVFIFSDDHASHALSCYGSKINQTPHLDRIANEGMIFANCFCTNSLCGPSRAVILTGKHSHINGFKQNGNRFNAAQQTFPKLLQTAGYQTAIVGKWHLGTEPTGFNYWQILRGQGTYYNPNMKEIDNPKGVKHVGYTTDIITDVALDFLKNKRDRDKPFMLMYQNKAPHRNWQPGPKYLDMYDGVTIPEPDNLFDNYEGRGTAAKQQDMMIKKTLTPFDLKFRPPRNLKPDQLKVWNAAYNPKNKAFREANLKGKALIRWKYQRYIKDYLRCIASVDDNVGRFLKYLDDSGLAKNTVVIYCSDQGFFLGDHGWFDKRFMYEEAYRMPFMVRWPGKVKPGSVNHDLVSNLDFAETFLDIAGARIPGDMQGMSFKSLMTAKNPLSRKWNEAQKRYSALGGNALAQDVERKYTPGWRKSLYYHYYEFYGNRRTSHLVRRHYGVRTRRYKLIHFYNLGEWELYDLQKDPREMKSEYSNPEYAGAVKRLTKEVKRLQAKFHVSDDTGSVPKNPPVLQPGFKQKKRGRRKKRKR